MIIKQCGRHPYIANGVGVLGGVLCYGALAWGGRLSRIGRVVVSTLIPAAAVAASEIGRPTQLHRMQDVFERACKKLDKNLRTYGERIVYNAGKGVTLHCPISDKCDDGCDVKMKIGVGELLGPNADIKSKLQTFKEKIDREHKRLVTN